MRRVNVACGAGDSIKPGVEQSGTQDPQAEKNEPAEAGDSSDPIKNAVAHSVGWCVIGPLTWGCATLHPRLYANVRLADSQNTDQRSIPGPVARELGRALGFRPGGARCL